MVSRKLSSNEQTPLLASADTTTTADPDGVDILRRGDEPVQENTDKPLPIKQLLLLCLARVVEPIAFFTIFPFINQMIAQNGNIVPARVGFYSGLIESIFSLTQMTIMIFWGRLSDKYGRKPVLTVSLFGIAFATALFGFAHTIWQMILFRSLAGVFGGTIVTIRTMFSEHSTPQTQARAFSWFAFTGNLGIFVGPLIGGALADPAKQYGGVFRRVKFFEHFPYAMPTIATGTIAFIAAIFTLLFVKETLPTRSETAISPRRDSEATIYSNSSNVPPKAISGTWSLFNSPGVLPVLYLYGHIMVLAFGYTAIVPVALYTPIDIGGFGFSPAFISIFMGLSGAAQAIWLLLVFPPLQHRVGTGGVLRLCARFYPVFLATFPALNMLLRHGSKTSLVAFWILAPILQSLGSGVAMSFTAIQLALNDVSPSPQTLGTLNALALTFISGLRAFCPITFASIYAAGVKNQILWGYLAWLVLVTWASGLSLALRWLPKVAEGKITAGEARDA